MGTRPRRTVPYSCTPLLEWFRSSLYVSHYFIVLLLLKVVFHLNGSTLGAAVSFLGCRQPMVVPVFLCACEDCAIKDY